MENTSVTFDDYETAFFASQHAFAKGEKLVAAGKLTLADRCFDASFRSNPCPELFTAIRALRPQLYVAHTNWLIMERKQAAALLKSKIN